jgi:hypothetical protein
MLLGFLAATGKMYKDSDFGPWLTAGVDECHALPT